jgi:hypothetical protein
VKLLRGFLLIMTLLGQFGEPALSQQAQSGGISGVTSNTPTSNAPTFAAPVINPVNSSPVTTTLSPTGARRSSSISTITVCDFTDFSGSFPSVDDGLQYGWPIGLARLSCAVGGKIR